MISHTYFPNAKHSRVTFCPTKAVVSGNLTLRSARYFLVGPVQKINMLEFRRRDGHMHTQHKNDMNLNKSHLLLSSLVAQNILVHIKSTVQVIFARSQSG